MVKRGGAELRLTLVDAARFITEVRAVMHTVTLLSTMDAGAIATLELIRSAGQQS